MLVRAREGPGKWRDQGVFVSFTLCRDLHRQDILFLDSPIPSLLYRCLRFVLTSYHYRDHGITVDNGVRLRRHAPSYVRMPIVSRLVANGVHKSISVQGKSSYDHNNEVFASHGVAKTDGAFEVLLPNAPSFKPPHRYPDALRLMREQIMEVSNPRSANADHSGDFANVHCSPS
jgi:hypothetical protein